MKRRLVIAAGAAVVVLVTAIAGATSYGQRQARAAISAGLEQAKRDGMVVSVEAVDVDFFARHVTLRGFKADSGVSHYAAQRIVVTVPLLPLLRGEPLGIVDIEADSLTLETYQTFPALASEPPQTLNTTYAWGHLSGTAIDMAALIAAVPAINRLQAARPTTLAEFKALDFTPLRALSVERLEVEHMTVVRKTPQFRSSQTIDAIHWIGLAHGTLNRQSLDGMTTTMTINGVSPVGSLDMTVGVRHQEMIGLTVPEPGKVLSALGDLLGISSLSAEGITLTSPSVGLLSPDPTTAVAVAKIALSNVVRGPQGVAALTFALEGLSVPLDLLDSIRQVNIARELGLKSLDISFSISGSQDTAGQAHHIGPITLDVKGLAALTLAVDVEGIGPPVGLEAMVAKDGIGLVLERFHKATFKDLSLAVKDYGLIHKIVEKRATASGQSVEQLAAAAPAIIGGALAPLLGETNGFTVGNAMGAMMGGKTMLTLEAITKTPIPFTTLGAVETTPLPAGALTLTAKAQ